MTPSIPAGTAFILPQSWDLHTNTPATRVVVIRDVSTSHLWAEVQLPNHTTTHVPVALLTEKD